MKRAVIWGSAMASFTVEKFGTERIAHLDIEILRTPRARSARGVFYGHGGQPPSWSWYCI
jgi:hypothetical protein